LASFTQLMLFQFVHWVFSFLWRIYPSAAVKLHLDDQLIMIQI